MANDDTRPFRPKYVIDMYAFDALKYFEFAQVSSVMNVINNDGCLGWTKEWGREFSEEEVWEALRRLLVARCVRLAEVEGAYLRKASGFPVYSPGNRERYWFGPTDIGMALWEQWQP
ncbi:MAG: hypothetical protein KDA21_01670 [Phycisphaerales bacterium]|nr:hypothetical protein [Phycisphaerales bacterium]